AILIIISFVCCSEDNNTPDPIPAGWERSTSPTGYKSLTDIEFYNNDFGVICGADGAVLKTENGGLDWQILNVGVSYSFMKVFILNENEFFISRHGLYKTNNGGRNFIEIGDLSSFGATIFEIHFFDSDNGLIYKSGRVFKTNDGGQNWEEVYEGGFCDKMQFVSDKIGYLAGGASWDGMSYGELHKTIDGGNNWTNLGMTEEIYNWEIMAMNFISEDTGFIANFNREIYITQDGGITWDKRCDKLPHFINDIIFLSKEEGYGAAYWGILKTTDGGITWNWDYKNESFVLVSIAKTPDNKIVAVGNGGVILRKE
ncbi:MAG: hypothetical protein GQ564_23205, partial [Bacteroidales bacterium]|nr:hypothetical protein [Bacteroidales bacterium]